MVIITNKNAETRRNEETKTIVEGYYVPSVLHILRFFAFNMFLLSELAVPLARVRCSCYLVPYTSPLLMAAWAAARRARGTR